jgi:uncharacterized protein YneF (UPF0154 family)
MDAWSIILSIVSITLVLIVMISTYIVIAYMYKNIHRPPVLIGEENG